MTHSGFDRLLMGSPLRRSGVSKATTAALLVILAFATTKIEAKRHWNGQTNAPHWFLASMSIYTRITQVSEKHLNQPISPHMFRDAAATFITELAPEHAMMAARVLQHASLDVTMRYYVHGQQHLAALKYHSAIDEIITRGAAETIGF